MKPKYHFLKNAKYALEGIAALWRNEMSFRIEVCVVLPAVIFSLFLPVSVVEHLFLVAVLFVILVVESLNSVVESCVDLVTKEWQKEAKAAKDCASAAVFFSILLAVFVWGVVLFNNIDKIF